jgi:mono/diheme cytochrome c family protein
MSSSCPPLACSAATACGRGSLRPLPALVVLSGATASVRRCRRGGRLCAMGWATMQATAAPRDRGTRSFSRRWRAGALLLLACGGAARSDEEDTVGDPPAILHIRPRAPANGEAASPPGAPTSTPPSASEASVPRAGPVPGSFDTLPAFGAHIGYFPFPSDGSPDEQKRWLVGEAQQVLAANCGQCHGPREAFEVQGALGDINDFDALVRHGALILCDARHSPVILRMLDQSMPPPPQAAVGGAEIAVVRDATDLGCDSE